MADGDDGYRWIGPLPGGAPSSEDLAADPGLVGEHRPVASPGDDLGVCVPGVPRRPPRRLSWHYVVRLPARQRRAPAGGRPVTGVRRRVLAAAVVFVAALVASWVVAAVGPRNWSPPMCGIAVAVVLAGLIWPRGS